MYKEKFHICVTWKIKISSWKFVWVFWSNTIHW